MTDTNKDFLDMRECIILDLDGTTFDCSHRLHYLDHKDWGSFFRNIPYDPVIEHMKTVVHALRTHGLAIVVVTARPEDECYDMTLTQLEESGIEYDALYMRKKGDYSKDTVAKKGMLDQLMFDGFYPILAFDDKNNICEMFRENGIPAFQVASDEPDRGYSKRYAGQTLLDMLVGPSGAGKSTFIQEQIKKGVYKPSDIISSDAIRDELFGGHEDGQGHTSEDIARTWRYIHALVKARLDNGVFTVLDSTAIKRKDRMETLKIVPKGVLVNYVILDREYDEKLKTRGWRPETLVAKHHNTFKQNLKDLLKADNQPNVIVLDKRQHKV